MKNNEKGITIVALVVVIIVMIIISGIVIYEGTSIIGDAKTQSINTNLLLIQAKAKTIKEKKEFKEIENYIGTLADEQIKTKIGVSSETNIYVLSQTELDEIGLDVSGNNKYAVDYDSENIEIYYIDGVKDKENNRMCYSLTDISQLIVNEDNE